MSQRRTDSVRTFRDPLDKTRGIRSDRWKLVALEWAQIALGAGILGMIAVRATVSAADHATAIGITIAGMLAMVLVTFALRVRLGHASLRRDVQALEVLAELEHDASNRRRRWRLRERAGRSHARQ